MRARVGRRRGSRSDPYTVVEVNDTASEAALAQKLELGANVAWQCMLPPADDDRGEEEAALVDQAFSDRLAGEFGTADGDAAVRGLLEPRDRCWVKIVLDPRPRARQRMKRPGVHDLFGRSPDLRKVPGHRRPIGASAHSLPEHHRFVHPAPV